MNEKPLYSEISEAEMRDLEAEFGRPLTRELALWLIRIRTNREAIQRMIGEDEKHAPPEKAAGPDDKDKEVALAAR